MCQSCGSGGMNDEICQACPAKLVARRSPPSWKILFKSPLEVLLVTVTTCLGVAFASAPTSINLPTPGTLAAVVQGILVVLHGVCEGSRLQLCPVYVSAVLLAINASGVFGGSGGALIVVGMVTLTLASASLLLCLGMPQLLPLEERGPYAVAIATEHIRTPVESSASSTDDCEEAELEPRPLELMAQVFYPVDKTRVSQLPWFPSSVARFRKSLVPAWTGARRVGFGLTQAGFAGTSAIIGVYVSRTLDPTAFRDQLSASPAAPYLASEGFWAACAAIALCVTCVVSDIRLGRSRQAFKSRYLAAEQARLISGNAKMPGWLTKPISGFYGPGFEAGHFYSPDVPCFPAAGGERKRPMVIFSHGLLGNRSMYSVLAADMASHGYVIVVLEHNDGSASSCFFPDGRITSYEVINKSFHSPEMRALRQKHLKRRGREIKLTTHHLENLVCGRATDFEASRRVGLGNVLDTKGPYNSSIKKGAASRLPTECGLIMGYVFPHAFVGHSFGGATVLQELSNESSRTGSDGRSEYSMAFIMDPWTFPTSDDARKQTVKIPIVIVTGDKFLGEEGIATEDKLVENAISAVRSGTNELALQLRVTDIEHTDFSDSSLFAPKVMRRLKIAGKMDGVTFLDQVSRLALCTLEVFLRRRTESGEAVKTPPRDDLISVLSGSDLPTSFPEASVRRVCLGSALRSSGEPMK